VLNTRGPTRSPFSLLVHIVYPSRRRGPWSLFGGVRKRLPVTVPSARHTFPRFHAATQRSRGFSPPMSTLDLLTAPFTIQFNFYSSISQITNSPLEGFTVCPHTTSLTFDLTSDQEQLPKEIEKTLSGVRKVRNYLSKWLLRETCYERFSVEPEMVPQRTIVLRFFDAPFYFLKNYLRKMVLYRTQLWKFLCGSSLKEPFFKVLWHTFIGSLKISFRKWFSKEPWFERFFVEPEMLP